MTGRRCFHCRPRLLYRSHGRCYLRLSQAASAAAPQPSGSRAAAARPQPHDSTVAFQRGLLSSQSSPPSGHDQYIVATSGSTPGGSYGNEAYIATEWPMHDGRQHMVNLIPAP